MVLEIEELSGTALSRDTDHNLSSPCLMDKDLEAKRDCGRASSRMDIAT